MPAVGPVTTAGDPVTTPGGEEAVDVVLGSDPARPPTAGEIAVVDSESGERAEMGTRGLERPGGGCSTPIPLPDGFEPACRTHDLGYQLLRAAGERGHPLPASARRSIDARLAADLRAGCRAGADDPTPRTACAIVATVVVAVVRANSIRQHDGPPVHEDWGVDL